MESSRKRFGLTKRKLVKSLYRAAAAPKPSPAIQYGSSSSRVPNYPSEGFDVNQVDRPSTIHHHHNDHQQPKQNLVPYNPNSTTFSSSSAGVDFIMNQEQVTIPHKPKISFYISPTPESTDREYSNSSTTATTYSNYAKVDNENVDLKAANYISSVQERFRLERINSERKAHYFSHSQEPVLQLQQ
ncbi:uncharacterized protein LOC132622101 [Lycium barbarum]|uniref:uncharacterized protein LOC132622101 n=1 Tax=Lycium barbarum TaxID=112863 RepID=UPI00293EACEE|nr:uncharacterized protein LOC132622101 [Lycium barbarum]